MPVVVEVADDRHVHAARRQPARRSPGPPRAASSLLTVTRTICSPRARAPRPARPCPPRRRCRCWSSTARPPGAPPPTLTPPTSTDTVLLRWTADICPLGVVRDPALERLKSSVGRGLRGSGGGGWVGGCHTGRGARPAPLVWMAGARRSVRTGTGGAFTSWQRPPVFPFPDDNTRMKRLRFAGWLAALLLWAGAARAQEVLVPLDERGRVEVVDAALAARLGLFADEYPGFREARLFRRPIRPTCWRSPVARAAAWRGSASRFPRWRPRGCAAGWAGGSRSARRAPGWTRAGATCCCSRPRWWGWASTAGRCR